MIPVKLSASLILMIGREYKRMPTPLYRRHVLYIYMASVATVHMPRETGNYLESARDFWRHCSPRDLQKVSSIHQIVCSTL